jgi:hypothetical protein
MSDLISEGVFLVSGLTAIFIILTIIVKNRRNQKIADYQRQDEPVEQTSPDQPQILNLD